MHLLNVLDAPRDYRASPEPHFFSDPQGRTVEEKRALSTPTCSRTAQSRRPGLSFLRKLFLRLSQRCPPSPPHVPVSKRTCPAGRQLLRGHHPSLRPAGVRHASCPLVSSRARQCISAKSCTRTSRLPCAELAFRVHPVCVASSSHALPTRPVLSPAAGTRGQTPHLLLRCPVGPHPVA